MKSITGLLLLMLLGLFVCTGSAEENSYQNDYFEEQVHQHCHAGMGISSNIQENINDSVWDCLDFQITKAIADEKEFMVEIVAILNDHESEIRIWEEGPRWLPVTEWKSMTSTRFTISMQITQKAVKPGMDMHLTEA